jgi:hypothetical protein
MWRPRKQWDREITRTLARARSFFLSDLLPPGHSQQDAAELTRAAGELVEGGQIRVVQAAGFGTIVFRCTDGVPDPPMVKRLLKR